MSELLVNTRQTFSENGSRPWCFRGRRVASGHGSKRVLHDPARRYAVAPD